VWGESGIEWRGGIEKPCFGVAVRGCVADRDGWLAAVSSLAMARMRVPRT
jgi:hypothetical protein